MSVIEQVTLFLFIAFVILTAVCNRLSIDDLFFKYRIDTVGPGGIIDEQYSRVMAYFLNGCIIATNSQVVFVLYNLLSIFVFAYFLVKVLPGFLPTAYEEKNRFALLFFLFVFCCCSKPAEVFFWYTQVSTYLWCMNCILIAVYFLQKGFRHKWQIPLFWLTCLFIGSSSEFLALQFLALLPVYYFWKKPTLPSTGKIIYLTGLVLLSGSLAVTLFSPGVETRSGLLAADTMPNFMLSHFKFVARYFAEYVHLPRIAFLTILFVFFFFHGTKTGSSFKLRSKEWIAYFIFVFCSLLITTYTLHDLAPARALIICDILGLFLIAKAGMQLGWLFRENIRVFDKVITGMPLFFILLLFLFGYMHCRYAIEYDRREQYIASATSDPIYLKLLPDCYFIESCNISVDRNDFRNQHLKLSHGSNADMILDWSSCDE